jgi:NAD(P)-dependent dehydrogenase (short-subunit alcohol dehydrogenase family)
LEGELLMSMDELDEVAIVTGAGSGIGRGIALALARAGARVAVTDMNDTTGAETHNLIKGEGGTSTFIHLDVTDETDWERVILEVTGHFGAITVLVNNAGLKSSLNPRDRGLLDIDLITFNRVLNVNLRGPMMGARAVLPGMLDGGRGSIIMISSVAAFQSIPGHGIAYVATKAALNALMRSIAVTYGKEGIRCNSIAPGVILGNEDSTIQEDDEKYMRFAQRCGRPSDIAATAVFLASKASGFINGTVVTVDGGLTACLPIVSRGAVRDEARSS